MLPIRHARAQPRVVVIGAGICGAFAAYWLGRMGASTTVLDSRLVPMSASVCNPGGLNPLYGPGIPGPMQALALKAFELHHDTWGSLRELTGVPFGGRRAPRVTLAVDDHELAALREAGERYRRTPGFTADWLDGDQLRSLEPRLSETIIGALHTEGDAKVDANNYLRAVIDASRRLGVELVGEAAQGIHRSDDRVTAVRAESGPITCDAVIVATGPWTSDPGRWLGVRLPVTPVKGDLLLVRPLGGGLTADMVWNESAIYDCGGGLALLGGTEERAGFDLRPAPSTREAILQRASKVWPGIDRSRVLDHLAALRPVSEDGRPLVGLCPGWENVYLALGAGRKGMLLSAGIGRAVAELAIEGTTSMPIDGCPAERLASDTVAQATN